MQDSSTPSASSASPISISPSSIPRVRKLPQEVVDKIAAGEVSSKTKNMFTIYVIMDFIFLLFLIAFFFFC
jgi:hypothetical protein